MWVDEVHRSILKVKLYWVGLPSKEGGGQGHELRLTTWRCPGNSCCMPRSSPWSWKLTFSAKIAIVPNISHSSSALTLQTPQLMWVVRWEFKKYFSIWPSPAPQRSLRNTFQRSLRNTFQSDSSLRNTFQSESSLRNTFQSDLLLLLRASLIPD